MEKINLYYLGSGPIAVPILRALRRAEHINLVGVGTQPDRPAGRNRKFMPTPVGQAALDDGIPCDRVTSVNAPDFIAKLRELDVQMVLVVSFGQLLKSEILALPRFGCVNVHASLLPMYRGASPITAAILAGDDETGVCFMDMEHSLDTGGVYATIRMRLDGSEETDTLENALGEAAARSADRVLRDIASARLTPVPQKHIEATYTRKIRKEDGFVDWGRPGIVIDRMVRAYHPWPGAATVFKVNGSELRVLINRARYLPEFAGPAGRVLDIGRGRFAVAAGEGALELLEVTPQGRKKMAATCFVNGCREKPEVVFPC